MVALRRPSSCPSALSEFRSELASSGRTLHIALRNSTLKGLCRTLHNDLQVIELPIKHPELFETLGVAQPKGVLLYGPPGTGKTLLARAVAHHTDCTFIRVSGSELVQKYIGEGSRMVRPPCFPSLQGRLDQLASLSLQSPLVKV